MPISYMERKLPSMGMSASQARLLSITSRLTNNEFRSQTITNSKLRLATESQEASRAYMDTLNSQQLMFMNYDDNGQASKVELTPAVLYDYAPLKNQYILRNANNKVMISNTDATNFAETSNLHEFLDRYGLLEGTETSKRKTITYNSKYDDWKAREPKREDYKKQVPKTRLERQEVPNPAWDEWNRDTSYIITPGQPGYHVYIWERDNSGVGSSLYEMFRKASKSCHDNATQLHRDGCYIHVLEHMLDLELGTGANGLYADETKYPKTFITSLGNNVNANGWDINGSAINEAGMTPWMLPISDYIRDGYDLNGTHMNLMAAEHLGGEQYTDNNGQLQNFPQNVDDLLTANGLPVADTSTNDGKVKVLLSNYTNESTPKLKTLRQKCIDMLYVLRNYKKLGIDYNQTLIPYIFSFEMDMKLALEGLNLVDNGYDVPETEPEIDEEKKYDHDHSEPPKTTWDVREVPDGYKTVPDEEKYEEEYKKWKAHNEPQYITTYEDYISDVIVNDQPKAQWYTNLWHALNGSDTANVVEWKQLKSSWDTTAEYGFKVKEQNKSINQTSYEIVDNNLFTSAEWLRFALEHGIVSMEQAQFFNPAEDSLKAMELTSTGYKWNNIVYTSARDIVQQDNQKAIAMAEVKYKKRITEIENQDTKFDQDLKKLDTEHNALMTEYESIKEVLSKNVERSFKAFS